MIKIICSVTAKLLQNCEDLFHFYSHYFVDDSETRYSHSFPLFFPTICFILFVVRRYENRHMSWFGVENYQTRLAINFLTCACKCSCYSPPSFLQVKDSVHSDIPEKIVHDTVHVLFKQNVASRNVFRVLDTFKDSIGIKVISIWITVSRFLWNFSLKFGFVRFFLHFISGSHTLRFGTKPWCIVSLTALIYSQAPQSVGNLKTKEILDLSCSLCVFIHWVWFLGGLGDFERFFDVSL